MIFHCVYQRLMVSQALLDIPANPHVLALKAEERRAKSTSGLKSLAWGRILDVFRGDTIGERNTQAAAHVRPLFLRFLFFQSFRRRPGL